MKKSALALFALTYLGVLIANAPASLLSVALTQVSNGQATFADAQGTLWQGEAIPLIQMKQAAPIALHRLHWRITPQSLFSGKLRAALHWDNAAAPIQASLTLQQLELQQFSATLPAELLGGVAPLLRPAQLRGILQIHSEQLILNAHHINGNAVADWIDASSSFSTLAPLGTYRITLAGMGDRLNASLSTTSGALMLNGQGGWSATQGLNFQGTASAAADKTDELTELLNHLGPETAAGVHGITLSAH